MTFDKPKADASQLHKPIHKFAQEITEELVKGYEQIPKYHTIQKVIIPVESSESEDEEEIELTEDERQEKLKREEERRNALGVLKREGDKLFRRRCNRLVWWHDHS